MPSVALADHVFADVPDAHPHHADIAAVALAGITNGCGGGNFCPDANMTRRRKRRSFAAASDEPAGIRDPASPSRLRHSSRSPRPRSRPASSPAPSPGANGFLVVNGSVTLYEGNPDHCICSVSVRVYVNNVAVPGTQYVFLPDNTVFESGSASIDVVLPITAGAKTVSLRVNEYQGNEDLVAYASMSVMYVPFGATGTDASAAAELQGADPVVANE